MRDGIGPDSLMEICLKEAARSIKSYDTISSLSEELSMILFHMVLSRGALTPRVLSVSLACTLTAEELVMHMTIELAWKLLQLTLCYPR